MYKMDTVGNKSSIPILNQKAEWKGGRGVKRQIVLWLSTKAILHFVVEYIFLQKNT